MTYVDPAGRGGRVKIGLDSREDGKQRTVVVVDVILFVSLKNYITK